MLQLLLDATNILRSYFIHKLNSCFFKIIMEKQKAEQMLKDIEARHSDIVKLEQSLKELCDLFNDLALLVTSQVMSDTFLMTWSYSLVSRCLVLHI